MIEFNVLISNATCSNHQSVRNISGIDFLAPQPTQEVTGHIHLVLPEAHNGSIITGKYLALDRDLITVGKPPALVGIDIMTTTLHTQTEFHQPISPFLQASQLV